jgi:ethanolamine ammonia-lyase small subunit
MSEGAPELPTGWPRLRAYTPARIGLGTTGVSLPTARHLEFQLAHALARDAVYTQLETDDLAEALRARGLASLHVRSAATDRLTYLRRPDLGRRLDAPSRSALETLREAATGGEPGYGVAFVVADGLSATAVNRYAVATIAASLTATDSGAHGDMGARARAYTDAGALADSGARALADTDAGSHANADADADADYGVRRIAPVVLVEQGRVAIGDEIGEILGAEIVVVLIGERPGLSAHDSMGAYLTWAPRIGTTDATRNCISNIREGGLPIAEAGAQIAALVAAARRYRCTGITLSSALAPRRSEIRLEPARAITTPARDER